MNEFLCYAAGESQLAIDLGGLVDAIHVASTGVLGLRNIVTRNAGPKGVQRLDAGSALQGAGLWSLAQHHAGPWREGGSSPGGAPPLPP